MCCCCNGTIIELFVFWIIRMGSIMAQGDLMGVEMNRHEVDGRLWDIWWRLRLSC